MLTFWPAGTEFGTTTELPFMASPLMKVNLKLVLQAQVPVFCNDQVLTKVFPGLMIVPSGMVTSETNAELLQPTPVPANEEVEVPNSRLPDRVGGGASVGNWVGAGVAVGGVKASCVACWAESVWKAAVKIASTLNVGVAVAFADPQAVRARIKNMASKNVRCLIFDFFICMVQISFSC